jgi:uncharacterized protein (DUF1800 family)
VRSPATARHIDFQLAQYFVADKPPAALVDRLAGRFRETDGDLKAVMRTLLLSPEFRDSAGQKYKTPDQYVLSAVRAAGVEVKNPRPLLGTLFRLGMPLYLCPTPDGYKNTEEAWLSPDATTLRIAFATRLAAGNMPLTSPQPNNPTPIPQPVADPATPEAEPPKGQPVDAAPLERLLAPILSQQTRAALPQSPPKLQAALLLGGPDFMRR